MPKTRLKQEMPRNEALTIPHDAKERLSLPYIVPKLPKSLRNRQSREALETAKKTIKEAISKLNEQKKEMIDPIAKGLNALRKEWRAAKEPWDKGLEEIRRLVQAYEDEKTQKLLEKAKEEAKVLAQNGRHEMAEDIVSKVLTTKHTNIKDVTYRRTWVALIKNESEVPIKWQNAMLRPIDESALRALKDVRPEIPGIEWVQVKTVVIR